MYLVDSTPDMANHTKKQKLKNESALTILILWVERWLFAARNGRIVIYY